MENIMHFNQRRFRLIRDMIVILIAIMSFSISITLNFVPLYQWFVKHYHLANLIHISSNELMLNYRNLLDYLNYLGVSHWHRTIPASTNALVHFHDVKMLVQFNYLISLIFIPFAGYLIYKRIKSSTLWEFTIPLKVLGQLLFICLFLLFIFFNKFFIIFHKVLFRNQDWIFNPYTDPIILALPPDFFEACFIFCGLLIMFGGIIMFYLGKRELHHSN